MHFGKSYFLVETLCRRGRLLNYGYGISVILAVLYREPGVVLPRLKHEQLSIKACTKLYLTVNPEAFLSNKHMGMVDKMIHIISDPLEL